MWSHLGKRFFDFREGNIVRTPFLKMYEKVRGSSADALDSRSTHSSSLPFSPARVPEPALRQACFCWLVGDPTIGGAREFRAGTNPRAKPNGKDAEAASFGKGNPVAKGTLTIYQGGIQPPHTGKTWPTKQSAASEPRQAANEASSSADTSRPRGASRFNPSLNPVTAIFPEARDIMIVEAERKSHLRTFVPYTHCKMNIGRHFF